MSLFRGESLTDAKTSSFAEPLSVTTDFNTSTKEQVGTTLAMTCKSTYLTGTSLMYSGGKGSSALNIQSTWNQASGGFHNIYSKITTSGAIASAGNGVVGIKSYVTNSASLTDGVVYAGQFLAKQTTGTSLATASVIGVEGWFYETGDSVIRTAIGGNFGWHNDSTASSHGSGAVHRGVQIFCDNGGTSTPTESTGLCVWNVGGLITNAINVVNSGSGFTNFVTFADDGYPTTGSGTTSGSEAGYIKITVGSTVKRIKLYDNS